MLRVCVRHWCLLLAVVLMSVSSLPLPSLPYSPTPSSPQMTPDLSRPHPVQRVHSHTGERRGLVKRSNRSFGSFYRLMQRHSRYLDEQAFVEKMFRLFDMNSDNLIERDEFRAIMQLLGLISHSY